MHSTFPQTWQNGELRRPVYHSWVTVTSHKQSTRVPNRIHDRKSPSKDLIIERKSIDSILHHYSIKLYVIFWIFNGTTVIFLSNYATCLFRHCILLFELLSHDFYHLFMMSLYCDTLFFLSPLWVRSLTCQRYFENLTFYNF